MKRIAILAIALAASTTVMAQQGQGGGGGGGRDVGKSQAVKAKPASKAGAQATVQGGGQGGPGQQ
jgi:hypothetical protein